MADMTEYLAKVAAGIKEHLRLYIETDGREGYYRDMTHNPEGGDPKSLTLVIKTIGRKSGKAHLAPLLFNWWKDEAVIVGSKGGSDQPPAWFLNLSAAQTVDVQIRNKRYRCSWRVAEGAEREKIWRFMADYYPPYGTYQARTERQLPVVLLAPGEEIAERFVVTDDDGVDATMNKAITGA